MAVLVVVDARGHRFATCGRPGPGDRWPSLFTAWATVMLRTNPAALLQPGGRGHRAGHRRAARVRRPVGLRPRPFAVARLGLAAGRGPHRGHRLRHPGRSRGRLRARRAALARRPVLRDPTVDVGSAWLAWSTLVLFTLAGAVAGFAARRVREAERRPSPRPGPARRCRAPSTTACSRRLAVVQRRSDDDELVALARDQELELREFLFGADPAPPGPGVHPAGGVGPGRAAPTACAPR